MGAGVVVSTGTVVVSMGADVVVSGASVVVSAGVIISYSESEGVVWSSGVLASRQDARQIMQLRDSESASKEVIFFIFCSPFRRPRRQNYFMIYSVKQRLVPNCALLVKKAHVW